MQTVRISEDVAQRLDSLAKTTNRSKSFYANKALNQLLEDQEDYLLAMAAWEEHEKNGRKTISLEEMCQRLGIKDL